MTSYVATMLDNQLNFQDFTLVCARAFGALAEMREAPLDARIPQTLKPSSYHKRTLAKAEKELLRLSSLTLLEKKVEHRTAQRRQIQSLHKSQKEQRRANDKIFKMINRISSWIPPTPKHVGLKEFMLEQLRSCVSNPHWEESKITELEKQTVAGWFDSVLAEAKRNLAYHKEQIENEMVRYAERNNWLRELRASLEAAHD